MEERDGGGGVDIKNVVRDKDWGGEEMEDSPGVWRGSWPGVGGPCPSWPGCVEASPSADSTTSCGATSPPRPPPRTCCRTACPREPREVREEQKIELKYK